MRSAIAVATNCCENRGNRGAREGRGALPDTVPFESSGWSRDSDGARPTGVLKVPIMLLLASGPRMIEGDDQPDRCVSVCVGGHTRLCTLLSPYSVFVGFAICSFIGKNTKKQHRQKSRFDSFFVKAPWATLFTLRTNSGP